MSAGTWESHHAITTLMYRYADCVDRGDFEGIGTLFEHGEITQHGMPGATVGAEAVTKLYHSTTRIHADGTTRARHLNTNVMIDIDEVTGTATAQSVFLVLQATDKVPLQPIVSGRYRDRFTRAAGQWQFTEREMHVEYTGNLSDHLSEAILRMLK